jgi:hypothetical protein
MDKQEFLDKLKRAYMMEEEMAGELIDLCHPKFLPEDLPKETAKRLEGILLGIKADTLRHRKIVAEIIEGKI